MSFRLASVLVVLVVGGALAAWWLLQDPSAAPAIGESSVNSSTNDPSTAASATGTEDARILAESTPAQSTPHDVAPLGPGDLQVTIVTNPPVTPVPGILVELTARDGRLEEASRQTARTDAAGACIFDDLEPGSWILRVLSRTRQISSVEIQSNQITRSTIVISPGIELLVRVVDERDEPVADAEVHVWPGDGVSNAPADHCGLSAGRTDPSGVLKLLSVPAARTWVQAHHPFRGTTAAVRIAAPEGSQSATVALRAIDTRSSVQVAFGSAITPAMSPRVEIIPQNEERPEAGDQGLIQPLVARCEPAIAGSDATLAATFAPVAPGAYLVIARCEGFATTRTEIVLNPGEHLRLQATLDPGTELRGLVETPDDQPIASARVRIDNAGTRMFANTDRDGRFLVPDLTSGEIRWWASHANYRAAEGITEVANPPTDAPLTIQLQPYAEVRGKIVDQDENGLGGWTVQLRSDQPGFLQDHSPNERSRKSGTFSIRVHAEAEYLVWVTEPGTPFPFELPGVVVRATSEPIVLRVPSGMRASARITGTAVDADGQPALTSVGIAIVGSRTQRRISQLDDATRDESTGEFRTGLLPPGSYSVEFIRANELPIVVPNVEVTARETKDLGPVQIVTDPDYGTLNFALTRGPGLVAGEVAAVIRADSIEQYIAIDQGLTAQTNLPAGQYRVTVYGSGFQMHVGRVDIQARTTSTFEATLRHAERMPMTFHMPAGETSIQFTVSEIGGAFVFENELEADETRDDYWAPELTVGRFIVTAIGASGRSYAPFEFEVPRTGMRKRVHVRMETR